MADSASRNGQPAKYMLNRRTRSASFSSESSGVSGGAPLHVTMSDLEIGTTPLKRPASLITNTRVTESVDPVTTAADFVESIRNNGQAQQFQIGKPPHDDENVFDEPEPLPTETMSRQLPAETLNQAGNDQAMTIAPIYTQPPPAERRHLVQGVDAQTYYPPEACVFVANLPEAKSDTVLEVGVTKAFSIFGPVFVKIRRDHKNMPFAFCQYTDASHAERAQVEGKGLLVEGRACRTEMVKANRSYVMFSVKGNPVDLAEAESHLLQFGEVEELKPLNEEAAKAMNTPGAVYVKYKHFDPARDIISAYRYHDQFNIIAYDLKKTKNNQANTQVSFLARYEIDRRSIYVGNLPYDVENVDEILREQASAAGTVESVQVIRKPPKNEGGRPMVFAFVVYGRPDEALTAVDYLRGKMLLGYRLRVEKKNCIEQATQPRSPGANNIVKRQQSFAFTTTSIKSEFPETKIPATPNRPPSGFHGSNGTRARMINSGNDGTGVGLQSMSPVSTSRSQAFVPGRTFSTPVPYQQPQNNFASPSHGYQGSHFSGQSGYAAPQYSSPVQGYGSRFMSQNYTMSPPYNPHDVTPYGNGGYTPATPNMAHGMNTAYPGAGTTYYPHQTSPDAYWPTPYLQDGFEGYRYYAGYGQQRTPAQHTPHHHATRSVNGVSAGQSPTRAAEQAAHATEQQTGDEARGEDAGEAN
ncbi:hypothetical protein GGS20DRAFT_591914 [Poronia punctata]|nr:hypothetical protein GGS20DRAFT_591914 [Poronia punctata]